MSIFRTLLANLNNERLPVDYQEVEYIKSSGTQWINTGVVGSSSVDFELDAQITSYDNNNWVFGSRGYVSGTLQRCDILQYTEYGVAMYFYLTSTGYNYFNSTTSYMTQRHIYKKQSNILYVDGVSKITATAGTFTTNLNMYIFNTNNSGSASTGNKMKLYSCKIYENNVLVRNFVPCYHKTSGVIGLYDIVNNQFYANSGSGTFEKGMNVYQLPKKYERLNYIKGSGTQWIDTGIYPNTDTGIDLDFMLNEAASSKNQVMFGTYYWSSSGGFNNVYCLAFYSSGSATDGFMQYGTNITSYRAGLSYATRQQISIKNKIYYNPSNTQTALSGTITSQKYTMPLFGRCNNQSSKRNMENIPKMSLYSCNLYDGSDVIRQFVPVIETETENVGLYDFITRQFFANMGTGTFGYEKQDGTIVDPT